MRRISIQRPERAFEGTPDKALRYCCSHLDDRRNRQRQTMKNSLLILALVATITGVAGAHVLGSSPDKRRPFPRIETKAQLTTLPSPIAANPVERVAAPVERVAAVEMRRQPVPILGANRTPIAPRPFDPDAALPKDTAPGKMAESAAKAAIEADGYRGVRILQKTADGGWRARAQRGTTEVSLSVNFRGDVSAD